MLDGQFCKIPTFSRDFSGESIEIAFFERWGLFWQKKSSFEQRSVFWRISELEQKSSWISPKIIGKIAKRLID